MYIKRNKEIPMGYQLKTNEQHGPHQKTGGRLRCSSFKIKLQVSNRIGFLQLLTATIELHGPGLEQI